MTSVTPMILMQNVFIDIIIQLEKIFSWLLVLLARKAAAADVSISIFLRLIPNDSSTNRIEANITGNRVFPFVKLRPKLVALRKPTSSQVIVSRKNFTFFSPRHHHINDFIQLIGLLRFPSNIRKEKVIGDFAHVFDGLA